MADVDEALASEMGNARHERRASRKSFSRAVSHPRSPASLAASSGIGADAKDALLALSGLSGAHGAEEREKPDLTVLDEHGARRGHIDPDGQVMWADGKTVRAYINHNGDVGDAAYNYLGQVRPRPPAPPPSAPLSSSQRGAHPFR